MCRCVDYEGCVVCDVMCGVVKERFEQQRECADRRERGVDASRELAHSPPRPCHVALNCGVGDVEEEVLQYS